MFQIAAMAALVLAVSCASGEPHVVSPAIEPSSSWRPEPSSPPPSSATSAAPDGAGSGASAVGSAPPALGTASVTSTPEATPPISPPVEREGVYLFGARPVPREPVSASAHDTVLSTWNQGGSSDPKSVTNKPDFHPATRVILETKLLSGRKALGKLTAASVLAQTRSQGYWPFRLCFEDGLRQGSDRSGNAVLRFSIDTRGRVSYARVMKRNASQELAQCWRKATYAPKYRPVPTRRVDVELTAQLGRGDVPLPPRDPDGGASFESDHLERQLDALTPGVTQCYAAGHTRDRNLWGRVELRLTVDHDATVTTAEEHGSRFPDGEVTECIRALLLETSLDAGAESNFVVAWRLGRYTAP
jgi:hypothetical protein